ncbi:hypothetical protein C475_17753 [Halosimplex carlsbadense 2-9-1]|uniref:DUF5658 domain-containing protein n=1 Tax=Halosimplex carlsbadense 2-9-1 TaxID=797114 RepID=M0CGJ6_9EURY|nr:hypothetical protein C475_17753 [Halosimplex carlsbadense 2-9-1]
MTQSSVPDGREQDRLFVRRRERRMTRTHAALWVVILATTAADIVLTMVGLAGGLPEGNPVVRAMVASFGPAGLWTVKFAATCWLVAGWSLLSDRNASVFLGLFAAVTSLVVVNNAVAVFGA